MLTEYWVGFQITFNTKEDFPYELARNSKWIFLPTSFVAYTLENSVKISIVKSSLYFFS